MLASVVNQTTGVWDRVWGCSTAHKPLNAINIPPKRPGVTTPTAANDTNRLSPREDRCYMDSSADKSSPVSPYTKISAQLLPQSSATGLSSQIEALIMALNEAIRQQRDIRRELHHERVERSQERLIALSLLSHLKRQHLKKNGEGETAPVGHVEDPFESSGSPDRVDSLIQHATVLFSPTKQKYQSYKDNSSPEVEDLQTRPPNTDFMSVHSDDTGDADTAEIQKGILRASIQDVTRKIVWYEHETQRLRKIIQHVKGEQLLRRSQMARSFSQTVQEFVEEQGQVDDQLCGDKSQLNAWHNILAYTDEDEAGSREMTPQSW